MIAAHGKSRMESSQDLGIALRDEGSAEDGESDEGDSESESVASSDDSSRLALEDLRGGSEIGASFREHARRALRDRGA